MFVIREDIEKVKQELRKFNQMLEEYPDEGESIYYFKTFLRQFLRIKLTSNFVLPMIEVMTILKHEKPLVFHILKRQSKDDYNFEFLTGLSMNYDDAKQKIKLIINT